MKRPEILYVTPCWPHGKPFGSQLRVLHIARALQQIGRLRLVVVDLIGEEAEGMARTRQEFQVECYGSPRPLAAACGLARIRRALNARIVNPYNSELEEGLRKHVFGLVDRVDLVWFSYLKPMSCFARWAWPHSFMDIDDIPSTYERTLVQNGSTARVRWRARWHRLAWRQRERRLAERFTVLGVSSEPDRAYLRSPGVVHVVPNGFQRPAHSPSPAPAEPPRLGFIGQFSYPPNAEGIQWFARTCWPQIKAEFPQARLRLVGTGSDGPLKPPGPDIDALGWLADPTEEIASWQAMVVPVRIGAGTRVKVLEAFSRKCPVIGTRIGVFGHDVQDGEELLLGDTPAAFAQACLRVLREPNAAAAMAERAWRRFLAEWTWDATYERVHVAVEDTLARSGGRLRPRAPLANVA